MSDKMTLDYALLNHPTKLLTRLHKAEAQLAAETARANAAITGDTSDGYHTFNELYAFRMMYNAAIFNEWALNGEYGVHKSKRHFEGDLCFGGDHFVVVAVLPTGQISNHYKLEYWDLFHVPEYERAIFKYDGHTANDVLKRLQQMISEQTQ